jgi:uncharacterized iron-regulated membrane protein
MFANFRQSMAWLHTWFGLTMGFVLMVVFFFGTLSVFDREIDRWTIPETRFDAQPMPRFDAILDPAMKRLKPHPDDMAVTQQRVHGALPDPATMPLVSFWAYTTHRDPVLRIGGEFSIPNKPKDPTDDHLHVHGWTTIDPRNGAEMPDSKLKIGSEWFYPLHYSLQLNWKNLGTWIVGFAALIMMAALISGVIMHRKIFREFFTFRPKKHTQRSALDLHNLTGVVALPFHFFFAFTGLIIFAGIYFPLSETMLKPLHDRHEILEAAHTGLPHDAAGVAAPLASVDEMVAKAQARWAERGAPGEVGFLQLEHVGDKNGYVSVYRAGTDRVTLTGYGMHYEASTGRLIREDPPPAAAMGIKDFLTGLHLQHFEHWLLRWLYVVGGLLGCICIATGFIFYVEKRKKQHANSGIQGSRIVDALAAATVTGIVIAAIGMLVANRLLPADMDGKGYWEKIAFWAAWLIATAHAFWRSKPVAQAQISPAWREQCWAIAVLAVAAVLLNWATTGDHLIRTIGAFYWPVAGLDLALLASAGLAVTAANMLKQREHARAKSITPEHVRGNMPASRGANRV